MEITEDILQLYIAKAMHRIEDIYYKTSGACYLSFSGGRDSTIVLALIKMCEELGTIPKNAIPAVFCDTKIELGATTDFVKWVRDNWYGNVQIIETEMLFQQVLKEYGKPIVSKQKSEHIMRWQKDNTMKSARILVSNEKKHCRTKLANKYMHILHPMFDIPISNECCNQMKKKPFARYAKENEMLGYLNGEREAEGGVRALAMAKQKGNICTKINKKGFIAKKPIVDWSDKICAAFIKAYNIPLSIAYTEYGLTRTGCFCCPFALDIENNLENLHKNEPNRYKAALFYLKDIYIAQGVKLLFDSEYMKEYVEKWKEYEPMRYETLKKYRPDCKIVTEYEESKSNGQLSFFD